MTTANNKRASKIWCVLNCQTGDLTTHIYDFKEYCAEVNFEYRNIIKKYGNRLKFYKNDYLIWNEPKIATVQSVSEQVQYLGKIQAMLDERKENTFDFQACEDTLYKDREMLERTLYRMNEEQETNNDQ